ncbi:hypothetical protein ABI59_01765 [Acidobacteria bacterium Mor1]|nr:hypothetical protein ABI59_01765 [Acidobacteria bacterium Mor1]
MFRTALIPAALVLAALVTPLPAAAQGPTPEELVEQERLRTAVLQAFDALGEASTPVEYQDRFDQSLEELIALGEPVVDFLVPEIETPDPSRFFLASLAAAHIGGEPVSDALRIAVESANQESGKIPMTRIAWAGFCLALMGHTDGLDLMDAYRLKSAHIEFGRGLSGLEMAAVVLGDKSVPLLLDQLERYKQEEELSDRRVQVIKALARVGAPAGRKAVLGLLDEENLLVRGAALEAMGALGKPEDAAVLIEAMGDPLPRARLLAARALDAIDPGKLDSKAETALLGLLETMEDPQIRVYIYPLVADTLGERALPLLRSGMQRAEPLERASVVRGAVSVGDKGINLVRLGLNDPGWAVRIDSIDGLFALGHPSAADTLLGMLRHPHWGTAQRVMATLLDKRDPRLAPRLASMLIQEDVPNFRPDGASIERIRFLSDALVTLRYSAPADDLLQAAETMPDAAIQIRLRDTAAQLKQIAERGDDADAWASMIGNENPAMHRLALERLIEIDSTASFAHLAKAFDSLDPELQTHVLTWAARGPAANAAELARRVIDDPAYDRESKLATRDAANWLARRIGGKKMEASLEGAARRTRGRDATALLYLAVQRGKKALPLLRELRGPRMGQPRSYNGVEQERIDWAIRRLERGLDLDEIDGSPEELSAWIRFQVR